MDQENPIPALIQAIQALQAQVNELHAHAQPGAAPAHDSGNSGVKPPKPEFFYGNQDASRVRQWCFSVDTFFEAAHAAAQARVSYAATLLRGNALTWWQSLSPNARPTEWEAFKNALITYHQPISAVSVARDRLAQLTQRTSVANYVKDFKDLALNIPNFSEDERLDRFKRGLKHDVRLHVALANPPTFEEAVTIAGQVDDIMYTFRRGHMIEPRTSNRPENFNQATPMELDAVTRNDYSDQKSDQTRRPTKKSWSSNSGRSEEQRKGLCFYCKEPGHLAIQCPKKQQKNELDRR
jgi:hypothetical protein